MVLGMVVLCVFDDVTGLLFREERDLDTTSYIAISHVWGIASWQALSYCPWKVLASATKLTWLEDQLPKLVGGLPFWMDILAVDQADKTERIEGMVSIA